MVEFNALLEVRPGFRISQNYMVSLLCFAAWTMRRRRTILKISLCRRDTPSNRLSGWREQHSETIRQPVLDTLKIKHLADDIKGFWCLDRGSEPLVLSLEATKRCAIPIRQASVGKARTRDRQVLRKDETRYNSTGPGRQVI